jgi:hypothetical protein
MSDQTVTTWRVRSAINRVARQILSELDLEDWIEWEDLYVVVAVLDEPQATTKELDAEPFVALAQVGLNPVSCPTSVTGSRCR